MIVNINDQKGQSLIELVVAIAMLALAVVGSARLINSSVRASSEAGRRTQATTLATREFEALRNYRDMQEILGANPFAGLGPNCTTFVMRKNANRSWSVVPAATAQPYSQAEEGVSSTEFIQFQPFNRIVELCPSQEYNPITGTSGPSTNVRKVTITVNWAETDGVPRNVEFVTLLTDWDHQ